MPKFQVEVSRAYSSRHVATFEVEAETQADAEKHLAAQINAGAEYPEDDYEEQASGYDEAGSWEIGGRAVAEFAEDDDAG
jgi:hypothetical protein